ncbi:MAG: PulJ/GspJ family protein [Acidimicrobiales bacterium]
MRRHQRGQGGFTLIELLVTVVIIGTAFVVLVGGTLTGVIASNTHREKADGEIVLRRFIDYVKEAPFDACPGDAYVPTTATEPTDYWTDTLKNFTLSIKPDLQPDANPPLDNDGCVSLVGPPAPPMAYLQRLTLVVEVNTGGPPDPRSRQSVQILKRGTSP